MKQQITSQIKNTKATRRKILLSLIFTLITTIYSSAQNQVVNLWEQVPGEIQNGSYKEKETLKDGKVQSTSQVSIPTLSIFVPSAKPNQTAVIICPGGGYSHLAIDKEGTKVAQWLNSLGITAFVLKYRLPNDLIMKNKNIGPLQDAQEALRYVRQNAAKWNLDIHKIGIMGFSAGGHLAASLSTHYDDNTYTSRFNVSARPDFSLLIYPVISMQNELTHKGSQTSLLGEKPSQDIIDSFSNEKKVTPQTPPAFLIHATDDGAVYAENSIAYYMALKKNGVATEMHIYEKGGHGFGLGIKDTSLYWTKDCTEWLKSHNYCN
ncbi:alpha/beta hydrolase [Flavobacterium procerum]|uniref:Alpha/beta hydrolase n=1 Tax=Flavobacterium procerum TaxID=1455569 RepID=A0ABV6BU27_9FLAO